MADPKGFIYSYKYEIDGVVGSAAKDVTVGKTVKLKEVVYNSGYAKGNIYCSIYTNSETCLEPVFEDTEVGYAHRWGRECTFTMPKGEVKCRFYTGHWDWNTSEWIEDASRTITLTGVTETCSQSFYVKRYRNGKWEDASYAKIKIGTSTYGCNFYGKVTKTLEKGKSYTVEANQTGYECYDGECKKTFTACISEITLKLKKSVEFCNQYVKVVDQYSSGVSGVWVSCDSDARETGVTGKCTFNNLTKGKAYTLTATAPEGYTCVECTKTFTACIGEIALKLNKKEAPPEKKDTMICYLDVKDDEGNPTSDLFVGTRYTVKCNIYEQALGGCINPLKDELTGKPIRFVRTDTEKEIERVTSTTYGYAGFYWTPGATNVGKYEIKAIFDGDAGYKGSESDLKTIEVKSKPDKGVIVVVREDHIPDEKLKVQVGEYALGLCCYTPVVCAVDEAEVDPDNNTVTFELTGVEWYLTKRVCVRTLNQAGEVMDEVKNCVIEPPSTQHLKGWLGRPYRSWISVEPTHPGPGEGFVLKAHLRSVYTDIPLGEGVEVTFFRITDTTPEEIGTGLTNEYGVAHKSWSETLEEDVSSKTFKYEAEYDPIGKQTYPEPATVTVTKPTCPIDISALEECPIMKAVQGTVVFTHLDTLRWYRDTKMSPLLVNTYYRLIPITGRIARYSKTARLIVRAISTMSIRGIERKYGHSIPYLRYQQNVKL